MTQFKVGDKVVRFRDPHWSGNIGTEGVVTKVHFLQDHGECIYVQYHETKAPMSYVASNFKLVVVTKQQPHKHADLIKAWADGASIQRKLIGNEWSDIETPNWHPSTEYRIKPEPKPDRHEYVVVQKGSGIWRRTTLADAQAKALPDSVILHLIYDGETDKIKTSTIVQ